MYWTAASASASSFVGLVWSSQRDGRADGRTDDADDDFRDECGDDCPDYPEDSIARGAFGTFDDDDACSQGTG
jgi:hypothetical protein